MIYFFHISRAARAKYQIDDSLFSLRGTVVLANFYSARLLAQRINQARDIARNPDAAVQAGELNALGLIHEILHFILQEYRRQRGAVMQQAVATLYETIGNDAVETTLRTFVDEFPPPSVYRGEATIDQYLNGSTDGISNRETVVEEMLLLWLENQNPAASPFKELFDDTVLARATAYPAVIQTLRDFFAQQEPFGLERQSLVDVLRAPILHAPTSLSAQLDFMLYRWSAIMGRFDLSRFSSRVVGGMQLIQEEQNFLWTQQTRPFGGGGFTATTPPVPVFRRELQMRVDEQDRQVWFEPEPEKFSIDLDWMPRLVLIAKSTYVWLNQLSKKYAREIKRLDQIPAEELDELAQRGITGLWFIGVWERSQASARIKHLLGNTGAIASAYSLYDYEIAQELGGRDALEQLKARAWQRGIRLASDMVPNHMGIDSRWVIEHPEWFISSSLPPYPSYSFTGADLSSDPRVTIQIEDHYWDKSDAAVVFKRTDHQTRDTRYIYHGNDGTSFPWNDTAQLDYLKTQVREQVIQTILNVARQFPVIRFDAAMTLAKKHFERLWYPLPGETDTIPSRGEYAMTKAEFDAAMPEEFWREVVDRVAVEAPDTLLLAEAFWLMEGYFVRTLGMHRVYNSAFMHMLRDEKNLEYRLVIKNTIEFDPEILNRYVNFMNNPDERTAVDQFGKGDKYFGVCTMMVTMPGLPMFGHGQIEGFGERYGMEFRAALLDESPDASLVERHAREIFPLLHKRSLFAGVENFLLYDVYRSDGSVEENVFAYSNRVATPHGDASSLVAYNNSYNTVRGRIRLSAAYRDKSQDKLVQRTLAEGLNLQDDPNTFVIFRNHTTNEEFIRRARDIIRKGWRLELRGYQYVVYLDFRQVIDSPDHSYARLHDRLNGRGVPNIQDALREMNLEPLHNAFRQLINANVLRDLRTNGASPTPERTEKAKALAHAINAWNNTSQDETTFIKTLNKNLENTIRINNLPDQFKRPPQQLRAALDDVQRCLADASTRDALTALAFAQSLEALTDETDSGAQVAIWLDEWQLGKLFAEALHEAGADNARAWQLLALIKIALQHPKPEPLDTLLSYMSVAQFLNVNRFNDIIWFNQESFDALVDWYEVLGAAQISRRNGAQKHGASALVKLFNTVQAWRAAEHQSEYQVEKLLNALQVPAPRRAKKSTTARKSTIKKRAAAQSKTKSKTPSKPKTIKKSRAAKPTARAKKASTAHKKLSTKRTHKKK